MFDKAVCFLGLNNSESHIDARKWRKFYIKVNYSNHTLENSTKKWYINNANREIVSYSNCWDPNQKMVWKIIHDNNLIFKVTNSYHAREQVRNHARAI